MIGSMAALDLGPRESPALLSIPLKTLRTWDRGRKATPASVLARASDVVAQH
jgi:hypothetical protein